MPIQVLIADDHAMFRSGLRSLLSQAGDVAVVAETENGAGTVAAVKVSKPDVVLLDLSMPDMHGAEVTEILLKATPAPAIIIVTMHEDECYMRELFAMGVRGFVLKRSRSTDLLMAIRQVSRGGLYVDPHLAGSAVAWMAERAARRSPGANPLTSRENSVCALLALGHTNAEISERMSISERTVETHRANIMTKLRLKSRADLVRHAIDNGLLKTVQ